MTKTRQDKSAKPAAVELRDDALDRVAGGYPLAKPLRLFDTRLNQSISDGSSNTILTA